MISISILLVVSSIFLAVANAGHIIDDVDIIFGDGRVSVLDNGELIGLSIDKASGSGFGSKGEYLFGRFDVDIKLIAGNSAGTVSTFYLSSPWGPDHDEIDFEFLGNLSGNPYTVQTNVYIDGEGNKEQQVFLWFDPTKDFHTYSIIWNPLHIIFMVDGIPIREFKNQGVKGGAPYPNKKPMKMYATVWNGEDWATMGGRVKTDWSRAPFTAWYRKFKAETVPPARALSPAEERGEGGEEARRVQSKYLIYDYCTDLKRFHQLPLQCKAAS